MLVDPLDLPELDLDALEAELLRRGRTVYREFIDDGQPARWGLRIDPADTDLLRVPCVSLGE